ncbi:MAG: hypothetical protein HKN10_13475 [Myxococcales bacterium]|nr:hypothetical protein [Myxococcales bacterium]
MLDGELRRPELRGARVRGRVERRGADGLARRKDIELCLGGDDVLKMVKDVVTDERYRRIE